jgi:drug/metabolite transporter (DMT)-like permease
VLTSPGWASWIWIPIVLVAALAQTARNAAQRSISGHAGPLGATLARFLHGLPFAALYLFILQFTANGSFELPTFTAPYLAWLAFGALTQVAATALLLSAMKARNFVVAVTYSKTEVIQVALFALVLLNEALSLFAVLAMVIVAAGVTMLSVPQAASGGQARSVWLSPSAFFGLGSGTMFALATIGYRGAGLELLHSGGVQSHWLVGAWGVFLAQGFQTAILVFWLSLRDKAALHSVIRAWPVSLSAGFAGATASLAWFTAYVLQTAAHVRMLGMVEVLFSYAVSRGFLQENLRTPEKVGLILVTAGVVVSCLSA